MKRHWLGLIVLAGLGLLLALGPGWTIPLSAQAQTNTESAPPAAGVIEVSGSYSDPQEQFQVGILSDFSVSTVGGAPLLQNPDGSLAYTVVVEPLAAGTAPLPEVELLRVAQAIFGAGEGFQTQGFQAVAGGLEIAWSGQFTQAGVQPVQGTILAKQQGEAIYLLLVAATEAGVEQLAPATDLLANSLTVL
ncbi:hypothetical protein C7271_16365 [filamentous cyanobacterium CCP5]|nr:hypothetical protein C7271_16365 [filamentous cyanobacterium CCP5]